MRARRVGHGPCRAGETFGHPVPKGPPLRLPRLDIAPPSTRKALVWSLVWTALGVLFALVVLALKDGEAAGEYLTGFLIEKSLSLDNLFVFAVLFGVLGVRAEDRHRV